MFSFVSSVIAFHFLFTGLLRGFGFPAAMRPMFSSRTNGGVFRRRSGASRVSAKFNWMLERELTGLRYSYEESGRIIEDLERLAGAGRAVCQ
jgi:hypothetical protein